ncbi:GNAT family N-acetyltransferase [Massilia sp. Dwa41.01b]|uniref:GNAT family N-acetyltransferase n=1 Tax=unclassified Massilia TaxID=2609279 RepID=UPI0015FEF2AC|nr:MULTISPECIES: GNAT family N-acetyltransferase [unclassified Massilia]QNA87368.1 GNAT family N-acetyltransferase [Massilia sp. Dwa41.01b]QNA98274.1 GNAT family N-acetyltransferase [Massilia sp. Se16.2.3]
MLACAPADPDSLEARALIAALDAALAAICGDSGAASFDAGDVRMPRAVFLLARDASGTALGCGALRPLDADVAEIKRMYAQPGSGAGRQLLAALETQARAFGYREIWLETRRVNLRAVAFYERHGYRVIPHYGRYVGREDAVCLGKPTSLPDHS